MLLNVHTQSIMYTLYVQCTLCVYTLYTRGLLDVTEETFWDQWNILSWYCGIWKLLWIIALCKLLVITRAPPLETMRSTNKRLRLIFLLISLHFKVPFLLINYKTDKISIGSQGGRGPTPKKNQKTNPTTGSPFLEFLSTRTLKYHSQHMLSLIPLLLPTSPNGFYLWMDST